MSSMGGQWRVLRHLLSVSNLNAEVEQLVRKLKPATPEQWNSVLRRFELALLRGLRGENAVENGRVLSSTVEKTQESHTTEQKTEKIEEKLPSPTPTQNEINSVPTHVNDMSFEGIIQGLKLKKDLHFGNISEPGWKKTKPMVSKTSIHSRTAYVISALDAAESEACLLKRTEDLIAHLRQFPAARDHAVAAGAVRALVKRSRALESASEARAAAREALALLGATPPPPAPAPRVLSLDGGGIRGLVTIEILRELERLSNRPIHQLFDLVVGVSTGAIIAAVIAGGAGSLETAGRLYRSLSRDMFGSTTLLGGASRLVWTHSYYDTAAWERMLRERLGEAELSSVMRGEDRPALALVSAAARVGGRAVPYVFRSYSGRYRVRGALSGGAARVWQAVRASAAAPTYFAEYSLDGRVHQDGGLLVNNPAGVALLEARLLYGASPASRVTLVTVGTGRAPAPPPSSEHSSQSTSWRDKFNAVLDSATDTEGVHLLLNEVLPSGSYFRFNPPLTEPCAMDEINEEKLQRMIDDTHAYMRRNQHKLSAAAETLCRPRGVTSRVADKLKEQALLLGLTDTY